MEAEKKHTSTTKEMISIFPFPCNNILTAPVYGVYISQLIRYFRACGSYHDFYDKRVAANK